MGLEWRCGAYRSCFTYADVVQGPPAEHLLVPLLVLLAQQRQYIATQSTVKQLKLMLELFDQCTETLSQVRGCCTQRDCGSQCHGCVITSQTSVKYILEPDASFTKLPVLSAWLQQNVGIIEICILRLYVHLTTMNRHEQLML